TGDIEMGIGAGRIHAHDADRYSLVQLQAKILLMPIGETVSVGAVAAAQRNTGAPHSGTAFQTYSAALLASYFPTDSVEIDVNLGPAHTYGAGSYAVAGSALQYTLAEPVILLAEAFHDEPGAAKYQLGFRFVMVPSRVEAYVAYGNRFAGTG